jgi:hypothetical protein
MTYEVDATVEFTFLVDATDEDQAEAMAIELIKEDYPENVGHFISLVEEVKKT